MNEPTAAHIEAGLDRAKHLVKDKQFTLIQALAEATTTAQCQNIQGFKVFRELRSAVTVVLPAGSSLAGFSDTATPEQTLKVLDNAILVVAS